MSLGPFKALNGKILYKGNKIFKPLDNIVSINAPDLSKRHIELKTDNKWRNLILLYNGIRVATENFMRENDAIFFDLPITTRMISSPGALNNKIPSDVKPFKINMFDNELFLTQSSQLYLEFVINVPGINKVYCFDKSFRRERADFRHLPEFTHVEYEANIDFKENLHIQELYLKFLISYMIDNYYECMKFFLTDRDIKELLKITKLKKFKTIKFHDAFRVLKEFTKNKKYDNVTIKNFGAYEEILLTQILGNEPIFVTQYIADEVAFYHALDKNNKMLAMNADLLFPGYGEIIGSGERVHTKDETEKKARHFELNLDDYIPYIESRDIDTKIHSGWGMGIERFLQAILKLPFIWEVKVFPRVDNSVRP